MQPQLVRLSLTLYPHNLPGRIYGSAMPFGLYDPEGKLLADYRVAGIHGVLLLAELDAVVPIARTGGICLASPSTDLHETEWILESPRITIMGGSW